MVIVEESQQTIAEIDNPDKITLLRPAVPKLFWALPKSERGEHLATKPQTAYEENNDSMDEFWRYICQVVFSVRNLSFSEVPTLKTNK